MTDAQFLAWLQSPDAIRCALVEVDVRINGAESTLYLSSRPYVTGGADTPAHTAYLPIITGGVAFSEALSLDGQPSLSWGDIEIDNRDGSRDAWLSAAYVWTNRRVRVWIGDPRWPRADFRQVFDGVVADLDSRAADTLNLRLLDKLARLNAPMTEATLGGTTANKDRTLPLCFGECHNVTPLLVDPATLTYRVHDGAIEGVIEVRDNGAPLSGVTVAAASGTFTLGSAPVGTVTASVQGDDPAGVYATTVAAIVQRIATGYGPTSTRFAAGDLDAAQLAAFAAAHPQPVGLYAAERTNVLAACQALAASVGAQVVVTTLGLLRLVKLALPATGAAVAIGPQDIESGGLRPSDRPAVRAACKLGYCRNWTVQTSGLAGGLPAAHAELFGQEWLTVTSSDATTAAAYRRDTQPQQEDTLLLVEADATAEAARRRDLWKTPRTVFTARCFSHLLLTELGDAATLTHPRFGLSAGVAGIVFGIRRDWLAGRVELDILT